MCYNESDCFDSKNMEGYFNVRGKQITDCPKTEMLQVTFPVSLFQVTSYMFFFVNWKSQ